MLRVHGRACRDHAPALAVPNAPGTQLLLSKRPLSHLEPPNTYTQKDSSFVLKLGFRALRWHSGCPNRGDLGMATAISPSTAPRCAQIRGKSPIVFTILLKEQDEPKRPETVCCKRLLVTSEFLGWAAAELLLAKESVKM